MLPTALRCALVLVLLLPCATRADVLETFERAMAEGEWSRAAELSLQLVERYPQSAVAAYNAACATARAGRADEALTWLERSAELGFTGINSLDNDEDLAPLRDDPRFAAVREAVQARVAARFERFREAARRATPAEYLPPGHDPRQATPLLVVLHGTGGSGAEMRDAWAPIAKALGVVVLAPDALRPAPGTDGYSWTFRDEARWLVLHEIERARERYAVSRVILSGFSQGANVAFMLGQAHPEIFDGVIPVAGHFEADVASVPVGTPSTSLPRWYLLIGARDPWVETYALAERTLAEAGAAVSVQRVPRLGHAMPTGKRGRERLRVALAWVLDADPGVTPPQG